MLRQKKDGAAYCGKIADRYDEDMEHIFGKDLRRNLAEILENEHDLGNAVEFGCGTGYFTRAIAKNARHVTATDLSPAMLDVAKSRLGDLDNVSFRVENSERTSFPPGVFDAALMANMLHTLDDPLKALKECYRVLKNGGLLLIINYTSEGMGRAEKILLFFRFVLKFGLPSGGNWPMTSEKLHALLGSAGFRVERMELVKGKLNAYYARAKKT